MICPQCQEPVFAHTTICPSCGLTLPSSMVQRCSVCGARLELDTNTCPHCGTPLSPVPENLATSAAYVPPPADEQAGPPTIPYAQSRYAQPRVMSTEPPQVNKPADGEPLADKPTTIPVLTASATPDAAMIGVSPESLDKVPTIVATSNGHGDTSTGEDEAMWEAVPTLQTSPEPEDAPFAMRASPAAPEEGGSPIESTLADIPTTKLEEDGLPDYDTPDIERPAIRVPKPPLPDYDTPDEERPAIHAPRPPLPDYETPDEEQTVVHPAQAHLPTTGQVAPVDSLHEAGPENDAAQAPDTTHTYPASYSSPLATRIRQAEQPTPSTSTLVRIFGAQPEPEVRTANNRIQHLWLRYLPPEWAVVPWVSILIGALIALVVGLLTTIIGLLFWARAIGYLLDSSTITSVGREVVQAVFSPNPLQLFLLEHGISMSLTLGSPGALGSFSAQETLPLTGLSLIPGCALVLAGYIAATSDFSHRLVFSVLRGAFIGPIYGILLLLVSLVGSSTVHLTQNTVAQLYPSSGRAFLAGLLWGALFGAFGGMLAVRGRYLFTTNRQPDIVAGASWGALIALGSGLLLALVALVAGMAAHIIGSVPSAAAGTADGGLGGAFGSVLTAIALLIVAAPVAALWLFALGTGATIDSWLAASGVSAHSGDSTFGLLAAQHHPTSLAWWLLLLIPLASYIIGGRAAAHIARAESLRDGAVAGWLMAVTLSAITLMLTLLSRVLISSEATLSGRTITTSLGIAPSVMAVFLLVLIIGGVVGALGGASAVVAPEPVPLLASVASPLLIHVDPVLAIAQRPWDMVEAARGQRSPRTTLSVLLYAAMLSAVVLVALFLVVVLLGWIASHFAPISAVRGFDGFFAGLAVGVPLLLLASAAILVAMRTLPPLLTGQQAHTPVMPRYPPHS